MSSNIISCNCETKVQLQFFANIKTKSSLSWYLFSSTCVSQNASRVFTDNSFCVSFSWISLPTVDICLLFVSPQQIRSTHLFPILGVPSHGAFIFLFHYCMFTRLPPALNSTVLCGQICVLLNFVISETQLMTQ